MDSGWLRRSNAAYSAETFAGDSRRAAWLPTLLADVDAAVLKELVSASVKHMKQTQS